jgi:hypothetical protein
MSNNISDYDIELDEELNKIDDDIASTKQNLENLEHPKELNIEHQLNDKMLEGLYDRIRQMPRNEMVKLLANLAKTNQMPDHKFSTVSDSSRDDTRARLKKKLHELEMRRTKKSVLANFAKKEELKTKTEQVEKEEQQKVNVKSEMNEVLASTLTKSQKKRLKIKRLKEAYKTKQNISQEENQLDNSESD